MPNHLANSASPYLLQHQHNPVNWYPWGPDALQRAMQEQKPIFLSIGYAACHWCHVMERECFEDPQVAELLNANYVCIKVDREERPDIDQIYMLAVQMLTGSGGWPLNMFLAPDGRPFYGGTYWPPQPRHGMPSFSQILMAVRDAWEEQRDQVLEQATALTKDLKENIARPGASDNETGGILSKTLLLTAADRLVEVFDKRWGGFGAAPKFPHCGDLELLLRVWSRTQQPQYLEVVNVTLSRMAAGGIYDHLAGGFSRYSVDPQWLVPHFEKMLYDNAQLARLYLLAYQATEDESFAYVAAKTLEYLTRDLMDQAGGLHSSEDADSEGVEGKYYVWTREEILEALGTERGEMFCQAYGVSPWGNFEGKSILHLPQSIQELATATGMEVATLRLELEEDAGKLWAVRDRRVPPGRDDKVLTGWNALAIEALALGARVLGRSDFRDSAIQITEFILNSMRRPDERLLHAWRRGIANFDGYLDDYAYLAEAMLTLYETTGDLRWLEHARELSEFIYRHFREETTGGLFYTADDHEALIARAKDYTDASVPSSAGTAAAMWLRLAMLTGETRWHAAAEAVLTDGAPLMQRQPAAAGRFLHALDLYLGPMQQVVGVATSPHELDLLWQNFYHTYRPRSVLVPAVDADYSQTSLAMIMNGKTLLEDSAAVYLCENFRCQSPHKGFDLDRR